MSLNVVKLDQNNDDWLKWRADGIGASDAAAVMGVSPYLTPLQLWEIKTGRKKQKENVTLFAKGHEIEAKIRARYELDNDILMPAICVEFGDEAPFVRASLDGYNNELGFGIEIKYIGKEKYESGILPENYRVQIQYQMLCTGAKRWHYVFSNDGVEYKTVEVEVDEAYQAEIYQAVKRFWLEYVKTDTPPPSGKGDKVGAGNKKNAAIFKKWKKAKEKADKAVADLKVIAAEIEPLITGDEAITAEGVAAQWVERKGNIDYKAVPELKGLNLEGYRKKGSRSLRVSLVKAKGGE